MENMKAYGQSAGYADQALNAIRVVVAYGQEEKEVKNYTKYLDRARKAGVKTHLKGSFVIACFMSSNKKTSESWMTHSISSWIQAAR